MEPVGHTATQAVQNRQSESMSRPSVGATITVFFLPRVKSMALTPRTSWHIRTQRPHLMQRFMSWLMMGFSSFRGEVMGLWTVRTADTPIYWIMLWSSQLPYLGQPSHSAGWLLKISSMASFRWFLTVSVSVSMTMPSSASRVQAVTMEEVSSPGRRTSTTHIRQPPQGSRAGWLHRVGM